MNCLGIDFGTKNIGLAISIQGIISPVGTYQNNPRIFDSLKKVIDEYQLEKIYIGLSSGKIAELTTDFIKQLNEKIDLPVETVDESVSTIESENYISPNNRRYSQKIDSISAAVILKRALL